MLYHEAELSTAQKSYLRQLCKREMLKRAMKDFPNTQETDFVIREAVFGDDSSNAALGTGFIDLGVKTEQLDDAQFLSQSASDLTAFDLSSILTAGEKIDDNTYIGFYGLTDLSPEAGALTGTEVLDVPIGSLTGIRFDKGAKQMAYFGTEKLYSYPYAAGYFGAPVIYSQRDSIDIKMCFSEGSEDKFVTTRALIAERRDASRVGIADKVWKYISQDGKYGKFKNGSFEQGHISGGIVPIHEISFAERQRIRDMAIQMLVDMARDANVAQDRSEMRFTEPIYGDTASTDWYDLNSKTSHTAGHQGWGQDAGDLTALKLSDNLDPSFQWNDQTFAVVMGFWDRSSCPSSFAQAFSAGAGFKDYWQTSHCYGYAGIHPVHALTDRPIPYDQNETMKWATAHKDGLQDEWLGLDMIIATKAGERIA